MAVARENLSIEKRFLRKNLKTPVPDLLKKDGAGEIEFYGKNALERVALKNKRGQQDSRTPFFCDVITDILSFLSYNSITEKE